MFFLKKNNEIILFIIIFIKRKITLFNKDGIMLKNIAELAYYQNACVIFPPNFV